MPSDAPHTADLEMVRGALRADPTMLDLLGQRLGCVARMLAARNARAGCPLDRDQLDDVAQDVCATVWRRLGDYTTTAAFTSWVYGICEFHLRNAARKKRRQPPMRAVDAEHLAPAAPPATVFFDDVHGCLARLDELDQRIVRARHFDGCTFEEAAVRLAKNVNTVKSRYFRALQQLRACLAHSPDREEDS